MKYYFSKLVDGSFDQVKEKMTAALKDQGFGVLTEIDIQATLKKKIDVDFYKYTILGACNPKMAYKALQVEDKIGTMLPCNVILQQKTEGGPVEVSAIDPAASMASIENPELNSVAGDVQAKLESVIQSL